MQKTIIAHWVHNGLMDFIRGVIRLDQDLRNEYQVLPCIPPESSFSRVFTWSNSHLKNAIDIELMYDDTGEPDYVKNKIESVLQDEKSVCNVSCIYVPNLTQCEHYKWLLRPKKKIDLPSSKKAQSIIKGDYYCIHVRVGCPVVDKELLPNDLYDFEARIDEVVSSYKELPIVLVTDNQTIKERYRKILKVSETIPRHSILSLSDDEIIDFFTDIKLISGAVETTSICNFGWNSTGFSRIPCAIYGKPYKNVKP